MTADDGRVGGSTWVVMDTEVTEDDVRCGGVDGAGSWVGAEDDVRCGRVDGAGSWVGAEDDGRCGRVDGAGSWVGAEDDGRIAVERKVV